MIITSHFVLFSPFLLIKIRTSSFFDGEREREENERSKVRERESLFSPTHPQFYCG